MRTHRRWAKLSLKKLKGHLSSTTAAKFKNHYFEWAAKFKNHYFEWKGLEPKMLLWRPNFYQGWSYFHSNLLFAEFKWIWMSIYWVIVNLITHRSTCKPHYITILTVIVVCSESIFWNSDQNFWNTSNLKFTFHITCFFLSWNHVTVLNIFLLPIS